MKKILGTLALFGLFAALLVGCSSSKDHNDADITFAQQMVPHHEQAVEMADSALKTSQNTEVRALAAQIKAAQDPEITKMNAWLDDWDAAKTDHGAMAGMDNGNAGDGMMNDAEMQSLATATGPTFDAIWLSLMIKHHEGAVAMAETESKDGSSPGAKKLAAAIISGQKAEIDTMKGLMAS